jgi:L-asparaginase / beta-aspartyl-peptidase
LDEVIALYVHGGVSGRSRKPVALAETLPRGYATALDAVEAAVRALESHPDLNAGYGAVLNREGDIELDAGIADGEKGEWAGVLSVRVRHPISLARLVLKNTPHVLMSGEGAMSLAREAGAEVLDATTNFQSMRWKEAASGDGFRRFGDARDVDTVGAVALGSRGDLAAATSTGGLFGKLPGRVGDAPISGAGMYATSRVAVVGTGLGEVFLKVSACRRVGELVEDGMAPQLAVETITALLRDQTSSPAALLALDSDCRVGAAFAGHSWEVAGFGSELSIKEIS